MLTEQEARTKWCPHARQDDNVGIFRNALHDDNGFACIASECMAWRWVSETFHGLGTPQPIERAEGFCGLAGRI